MLVVILLLGLLSDLPALEKAKKQGKARHIGFSTHDRRWIKFMIECFPQFPAT